MNESHEKNIIESARQRAAQRKQVADLSSIVEFTERPFDGESEEQSVVLGNTTDFESADPQLPSVPPGTIIHQYKVLQKIGEGGMGEVYLAQHQKFKSRLFAIKFLRAELFDVAAKKRFEAEIGAMEHLKHDNIVYAYDAGEVNGTSYLVMDYVEGVTVKSVGASNRASTSDAAEIVRQTAVGLQHALENNLVHRDIKPSNLILAISGQVKILDMGLARINDSRPSQLTGTQQVLGTPDYMAPEQWQDTRSVDIRADIYSLGCTLYFLLAGRAPFEDNEHSTLATKLSGHLQEPPPKIQIESNGADFRGIEEVLRRMLEKDPAHRFQTPSEVADALAPFCNNADLSSLTKDVEPVDVNKFPTKSIQDALEDTETRIKKQKTEEKEDQSEKPRQGFSPAGIGVVIGILLIGVFFAALGMGLFGSKAEPVKEYFDIHYISRAHPNLDYRDEQQEFIDEGRIGIQAFTAKYGDFVKVNIQWAEPQYVYLIALNPTDDEKARIQLCYPNSHEQAPEMLNRLDYPRDDDSYFPMTDGIGQQAFVLIKSDIPLPDFQTWKDQNLGEEFPWKVSKQTGVWGTNEEGKLSRMILEKNAPCFRGDVITVKSNILDNSIKYLRTKKVDVEVMAYPVLEQ